MVLTHLEKKLEILFLQIDYNKRTSLHCHPKKKTAFVVLKGRVKVQYGIYKKNFKDKSKALKYEYLLKKNRKLRNDIKLKFIKNYG